MPSKSELSSDERMMIIAAHNKGFSYAKIAGIYFCFASFCFIALFIFTYAYFLDNFGISKSCAHKTVQNYKARGSTETSKRTGRPEILSPSDTRVLMRLALQNRFSSIKEISATFCQYRPSLQISDETIRRILISKGLKSYKLMKKPHLTKQMKAKRLDWCLKMKDKPIEFWRKVIFSDEAYIEINLNSALNRVRRFSHENLLNMGLFRPTVKFPLKLMIWGCFGYNGLGKLQICDSTMNSEKYISTLEKNLINQPI